MGEPLPPDAIVETPVEEYLAFDDNLDDHVINDDWAEWALRHLSAARGEREQLKVQQERWVEQIAEWAERRMEPLDRRIVALEGALARYVTEQRRLGRKSVDLPSGRIASRAPRTRVEIEDPPSLVDWLCGHDAADCVRVVAPVPDRAALLRRFVAKEDVLIDDAGEIVPGVTLEQGPPSVTITTAETD